MEQDFKKSIAEQAMQEKELGKIIVISGMSGAGKNVIADLLVHNHNYAFINKYVTRSFRPEEIELLNQGHNIGIKAVKGPYNDGEKTVEEQKASANARKQAFLNSRLPLSYINYDNYYGFSTDEIDNYIEHGRNVTLIVNDIGLIRDLKSIYGEQCFACYVHRTNPKNKDIFMEIAKQRGDTPESAEKRYQKAIKDFDRFTNNITLYDYTILNTEKGLDKLTKMLKDLETLRISKKEREDRGNLTQGKPKIYALIGNPGSGKDETLETLRVQGILHSIIMPKHTTRPRRKDDGEEMICPEDTNFNIDSCDLQYTNYGTTYGIDTTELHQRLEDGISSSLVVSDQEALEKLESEFPEELIKIYIQGLSKEEYATQQKEHIHEDYVQRRLDEYDKADEIFSNHWLDFDHVVINNGDLTDMKLQIDGIMRYYEENRDLSIESYRQYMHKANTYIAKFAREYPADENSK